VLDVVVIVTIVLFARRSKLAGALQVPYLVWILYATALNTAIVVLN
jgi:tryptophan-rich sensory protein